MTSVSPAAGALAGGNSVTIQGTGFASPTTLNATLLPGGIVSGTVTGPSGPLGGVCANALPVPITAGHGSGAISSSAAGSAAGTYQISHLNPGSYTVSFSDCTNTNSYVIAATTTVTVSSGATATVNATATLVPPGSITVTATGGGSPLTNAYITVTSPSGYGYVNTTSTSGVYTISNLRPDTYTVNISDNLGHYAATVVGGLPAVTSGSNLPVGPIALPVGGSISGTVSGPSGPVVGACVAVTGSAGEYLAGYSSTGGAYSITPLYPDSSYSIVARPCGTGNYLPSPPSTGIAVAAGQAVTGQNLVLPAGGQLSGRVTNSLGAPVPYVCVDALGSSAQVAGTQFSAHTAIDGTYAMVGLPTDSYTLSFSEGCSEGPLGYPAIYGAGPVTVTAGAAATVFNQNLGTPANYSGILTGHLQDLAGTAAAYIPVGVYEVTTGWQQFASTDSLGNYTIYNLKSGSYEVEFMGSWSGGNFADQWYNGSLSATTDTVAVTALTDSVTVGGTPAWYVRVLSPTSMRVGVPAGAGVADVVVSNALGTSATAAADHYTYEAVPAVTGLSPNHGPAGTSVTVTGSGFTGATAVYFGSSMVTPIVVSATTITATAPSGQAGPVDVQVANSVGISPTSSADLFTFPLNLALSSNPVTVSVASTGTSSLTATVTNSAGGVVGDAVNFTVTASSDGTLSHCGSITGSPSVTATGGQAGATYTAGGTPGIFCTITATEANFGQTATTTVVQAT